MPAPRQADDLKRQQGVAAQVEEVVLAPDAIDREHLLPQRGQRPFGVGLRGLVQRLPMGRRRCGHLVVDARHRRRRRDARCQFAERPLERLRQVRHRRRRQHGGVVGEHHLRVFAWQDRQGQGVVGELVDVRGAGCDGVLDGIVFEHHQRIEQPSAGMAGELLDLEQRQMSMLAGVCTGLLQRR